MLKTQMLSFKSPVNFHTWYLESSKAFMIWLFNQFNSYCMLLHFGVCDHSISSWFLKKSEATEVYQAENGQGVRSAKVPGPRPWTLW